MDEKRDDGSFEQRLQQARSRQGLIESEATPKGDPMGSGLGIAARAGAEMVSAPLVGVVIGYQLDRWLHSRPWFLLVFLLIGMVAGVMGVFRLVSPPKKPPE
jgi:ATP synthase protein I